MKLGACYYPEHWPKDLWRQDLSRMKVVGIEWVRVGEFAWSVLEPQPDQYHFEWLDQFLDLMTEFKLQTVLGTPTATPPIWMLERHPDMLAVDADGNPRRFGSRRHYCFSHLGYRKESQKITQCLAERYGNHPSVKAWQTDNEYGCHDTVISYSQSAYLGFQNWLREKYQKIENLNEQWGNVFWSMNYRDFSEIDLPHQTVTEPNPAQVMDFRRFSSDQVDLFNRRQVEIIRDHSDRPILHNYMGRFTDFDHYQVAESLDIASWDSYPLGFLSQLEQPFKSEEEVATEKNYYLKTGDPDFQAFTHELYYRVGRGRFWVMEQQPGPVNWAPYNPVPRPGMVRLWTWEAFFHGAEVVSYFRWRQAPWAQEQMHAGLLNSGGKENPVMDEIVQLQSEIEILKKSKKSSPPSSPSQSFKAAIVFDYESQWAWQIQPLTANFSYYDYLLLLFSTLRKRGIKVEIISPHEPFEVWEGYRLIFIPLLYTWNDSVINHLKRLTDNPDYNQLKVVLGPRCGGKTSNFSNDFDLTPIQNSLPISIKAVATFPRNYSETVFTPNGKEWKELPGGVKLYREMLETSQGVEVLWQDSDGHPLLIRKAGTGIYYLGGCGDEKLLDSLADLLLGLLVDDIGGKSVPLPSFESTGVRVISLKNDPRYILFLNYGKQSVDLHPGLESLTSAELLIGKTPLQPQEIAIVKSYQKP